MSITLLRADQARNLKSVDIAPHAQLNIIYGENASHVGWAWPTGHTFGTSSGGQCPPYGDVRIIPPQDKTTTD